ncbi:MAG TPA: hypothetical protein VIM58_03275 [Candidatus Methylacidiphilales bacterium]
MNPTVLLLRKAAAFSLIELVFALGICSVGIIAVLGLFMSGIQTNRKSQDQIQAANLASLLVSVRSSSPTNAIARFAIPPLDVAYAATTNDIGYDGTIAATASEAVYRIVCEAGTNALTGPGLAQVHLTLSWPPQESARTPSTKRYDILTYISLP